MRWTSYFFKFLLRDEGVYNRTRQTFLDASEIRLKLSSVYNKTISDPAENVLKALNIISDVNTHYDGFGNTSYLSLLSNLSDGFYHSVADFDPTILLQVLINILKNPF